MESNASPVLSLKNVGKSFDQFVALKDATFSVKKGEKVGLVGANGSGKTTVLKIAAGIIQKDSGSIAIPKGVSVKYLAQALPEMNDKKLSGGEKMKLALKGIMEKGAGEEEADLFLLDEPTNNLDIAGLEMLEEFVRTSPKAFVIVSHDREFLDKTVTKIIEIDEATKTASIYDGNYSSYREAREAKVAREWKNYEDKVEKVEKLNSSVDEKTAWMNKLERKRLNIRFQPMHEREKPVAAVLRDKEAKMGRRARIMRERLATYKEDSESIQKPKTQPPLHMRFEIAERSGTEVFEIKDLKIQTGKKAILFPDISIQYGERILIEGKNGAGKSTLLKAIMSEFQKEKKETHREVEMQAEKILAGSISHCERLVVGYMPQDRVLRSNAVVLDEFLSVSGMDSGKQGREAAHNMLSRFHLKDADLKKEVRELSPGEQSRLLIGALVARKPNCLILDEPTNHIDLEVLTELEEALKKYQGTLIVVSHDRYFVRRVGFGRGIL
jgi:ATPase subunit of ABC transporter with duplicated ATPase domains